jgi:hypothetical protein
MAGWMTCVVLLETSGERVRRHHDRVGGQRHPDDAAFARDLGESPERLRPRVMATIAMRGILDAWEAWDLRQLGDGVADLEEISELKSSYLERILAAGMAAIETLATVEYPTSA